LGKLDSVRRSEEVGYEVSTQAKSTPNKFIGSVKEIFKNLPNLVEWLSFYSNDLPLPMDFYEEVREASMQLPAAFLLKRIGRLSVLHY